MTDASFVVAYTMQRQAEQIQKAALLKKLSESETRSFVDDAEAAKAGFVKLGSDTQTFGALANQYVSTALKDDLDFYLKTSKQQGAAYAAWELHKTVVGKVKIWKTVANPATHFGNIMSNMLLATLDSPGIFFYMFNNKDNFIEAKSYGLFSGTAGLGDIETIRNTLKIKPSDSADVKANKIYAGLTNLAKNLLIEENTAVGDFARTLYSNEDNIFKAAYFGYYKAKYMKKGFDDATAAKYAIAETIDRTIDFTKPIPPLFRLLDNSGAMPFVSFGLRSTPTIVKAALRNPVSLAAMLGVGWGLFGGDDKDEAAVPAYAKGSHNLLFLPDYFAFEMGDNLRGYFNVGRLIPGFRYNPIDFVMRQFNGDPSDNGGQLVDNLGFLGSFFNILQGKDGRTGMSFLHTDKDSGSTEEGLIERSAKSLWMGWREFAPNYLGKTPQQFLDAMSGEKVDKLTGEAVTPGTVALSALLGKTLAVDMEKAAADSANGIKTKIDGRINAYLQGRISASDMRAWIDADVKKTAVLNDRPDMQLKDEYAETRAKKLLENEYNSATKKLEEGKLTQSAYDAAISKLKEKIQLYKKAFQKVTP